MQISNEDMKYNFGCASCGYKSEEEPAGSVDVGRFIGKLDELLDKNDMSGAGELIEYWTAEALRLRDRKGELSIRDEAMGYYRKTENREKAYESVSRCLELLDMLKLSDSITGGTVFLNAATVYKSFGESRKALDLYKKAQCVYLLKLEADDPRFAGLYNNAALAFEDLGDYGEAEILFRSAIGIMELKENGKPDAAISYINMASMFGKVESKSGLDIMECVDRAVELLDSEENTHNGYYYYVLSKCIPTLYEFGYGNEAEKYQRQVDGYYERA